MAPDLFSNYLKTIDHLNLKSLMFCRHTTSFKIRILEILNFHSCIQTLFVSVKQKRVTRGSLPSPPKMDVFDIENIDNENSIPSPMKSQSSRRSAVSRF